MKRGAWRVLGLLPPSTSFHALEFFFFFHEEDAFDDGDFSLLLSGYLSVSVDNVLIHV